MIKSIEWCGDSVRFIDQTKLPVEEIYLNTKNYLDIADAIRALKIRGAPLIGIAAAYAIALVGFYSKANNYRSFSAIIHKAIEELASTRPTAVNLSWALERVKHTLEACTSIEHCKKQLIDEAVKIHNEDKDMCHKIGEHGLKLIPKGSKILTYCNTGALATGGEGTAQSVITTAHRSGKLKRVFVCETRPLLQGARLTTWELMKNGIDVTLITDNMAAFLMRQKKIDIVITGADRIAANGDSANKIGTYNLAVLAKYHSIPFYIAAPTSTIDLKIKSGENIPIEERSINEVTNTFGKRTAPECIQVYSPAFDVTPAKLISAIITDRRIYRPPFKLLNK